MRSFKADETIITPPLNGVQYFVFIDISACRLQNFFLERSKPHFYINLRSFAIFFLILGRGQQLVSNQRWAFYSFRFLHMFK